MNMGLTFAQQLRAIEKRLAPKYDELITLVSTTAVSGNDRVVQALKAEQKEWLKYRGAECELVGALTGAGAGGSWPSTYAVKCERNLTNQRLRRVQSAIRCVHRLNEKGQAFKQNKCLQQLAPIANRI